MISIVARMGLRDKTTPTSTTPLIRANMSCAVATIFSSLDFSFFVHLHGQPEPFGSCLILQSYSSSVSTANLSCLLATTFSSLRLLSNSLSSPRFLPSFESGQALFLVVFISYFRVLSSAFLSSVLQSLKLYLL